MDGRLEESAPESGGEKSAAGGGEKQAVKAARETARKELREMSAESGGVSGAELTELLTPRGGSGSSEGRAVMLRSNPKPSGSDGAARREDAIEDGPANFSRMMGAALLIVGQHRKGGAGGLLALVAVNPSAALVRPVVKMLIHRDDTCHHVSAAQVEQMMRPPTDDGGMPPGSAAVERLARGLGRESPRIIHEVRDFTIDDRWRQRARFGFRYPDAGFNLNDAVGARRFEMRVESDRSVTFRMGDDETTSIAVAADASGQRIALVHESGIDAGFIDVFGGPLALEVEDRGQARRVKALFLAGNGPDAGEVAGPDGVTLILVVEEPAPPVVERSESSPGRPTLRWENGVLTLCTAQGTPVLETRASNESGRTARYIFADIDVGALVPKC